MDSPEKQSPYYRVSSRALILTPDRKLVLVEDREGEFQLPGGGWEHGESFEDCVCRELSEELTVGAQEIGPVIFTYRQLDRRGFMALRLVARVVPDSYDFTAADDMVSVRLVTKDEFMNSKLCPGEGPVQEYADVIWSEA